MNTKYQYHIEGQLRSAQEVSFTKADLAICAFVTGKEVGSVPVGKDGHYKLSFEGSQTPTAVELRLLPSKFRYQAAESSGLVQTVSPQHFVLDKSHAATYSAVVNISVPKSFIINLHWVTKTYRIHGDVYAQKLIIVYPPLYSTRPLPGVRIDFYEVNHIRFWLQGNPPPPQTERFLGSAYTDPHGSYDFKFQFTTNIFTQLVFGDGKPDIKVRVSQFRDGAWHQVWDGLNNKVWESSTDWEISDDFLKDYPIQEEYVNPVPDSFPITDTVFQYTSLGLLQIDDLHIVKGYATSLPGELAYCLLSGRPFFSHQPFCGILRIFGIFTAANVSHYKIQVAPAVLDKATGDWVAPKDSIAWEDVTDPLNNLQWNDAKKCWDWQVLGPTPDTHVYRNIDIQPEAAWCEHTLKLTWNSTNKPDGYYVLRIIHCEANGDYVKDPQNNNPVDSRLMPVLRVDNTLPTANLQVNSAGTCGNVPLGSDRKITFQVSADSPYGHILWTRLYGYRGKNGEPAGCNPLEKARQNTNQNWDWVSPQTEEFTIDTQHPTPPELPCPTMAYHFDLWVQGSATNGYDSALESRRVYKNVNLIVSENL